MDILIFFRAVFLEYWMIVALSAFGIIAFLPRFSSFRRKNWEMVAVALAAALIARFVVAEIIRFFYDSPRPFEVLRDVHQLVFRDGSGSFPSGHAIFAFAIAAVVARYYLKTSILFFLAAVSLSIARVQAGVHWPSDILGGAILGSVVGLLAVTLWKIFSKTKAAV